MQHQCPLRFLGFPLEDAKAIAGRDECDAARNSQLSQPSTCFLQHQLSNCSCLPTPIHTSL